MSLFYQSEIVKIYVSGQPLGEVFPNVQSVSTAFTVQRVDNMRLGRFAPMPYRQSNQDPVVTMNLDFIPTGNNIFRSLGLLGTGSAIDNLATGVNRIYDFKIQVREMVGGGSAVGTFNLRSGVLTNYSFQAAVGQTPRSSIAIEFLDLGMDAVTSVTPPQIDDGYPTLRPQDMQLTLPSGLFGVRTVYPQSFTMTLPLPRANVLKLGQRKAVSRELQSPIVASFQLQAIIETFDSTSDVNGSSAQMFGLTCGRFLESDLVVDIKTPTCTGGASSTMLKYTLRKPYLDSVNFSNAVGGYTSVEMQFTVPVTMENNLNESNLVIS